MMLIGALERAVARRCRQGRHLFTALTYRQAHGEAIGSDETTVEPLKKMTESVISVPEDEYRRLTRDVLNSKSESIMPLEYSRLDFGPDDFRRRVYISNMNVSATDEEVRELAERCGEVVELRTFGRDSNGQFTGKAQVVYAEVEHAKRALQDLHNRLHMKRRVRVREDLLQNIVPSDLPIIVTAEMQAPDAKKKVVLSKLPHQIDVDGLEEFASYFGHVASVKLYNHSSGHSSGIALIEYSTEKEARAAGGKMNNFKLFNRTLKARHLLTAKGLD
mmetsp:Transcript_77/g.219  ORF Transcript_77/g.219 Transcript_77/m.219 type:complete len:276 (+) Transcript_77:88-915(+)|eukprot:CAMPEP_0198728204 /NCGR_PEP_ID=MMETSP1475-20131203/7890_1 /TAXON_ID= ORGANISM="Unidentified sp., Strain CCMP1999" /NCGR_SAMPLE_ID=MMETSP1475 /ASSEMBLY_ACC=CAM_ASM_001111 /LENGTH=275 /DNA_ID=CAMNT_0044490505 /DNA_START=81 /DNA_END=908 /DNA_ORIENTATION=+